MHAFLFIVRLIGVLGSGEFGTVNKGVWESPMGAMDVAVKQLQPGASEEEKVKFLQEAAINGQFRHPNVVKLMGVVTIGEPVSTLNFSCYSSLFNYVNCGLQMVKIIQELHNYTG